MFGSKQNFRAWLFGLDRWKKRLLQIAFDGLVAPIALLLAFFMRLETTDYLYRLDTYIGVSIAMLTTVAVFAARHDGANAISRPDDAIAKNYEMAIARHAANQPNSARPRGQD